MLKLNKVNNMGSSNLGWLKSKFHFSFAEYFNPLNLNFSSLRVLNDDIIEAGTGFRTHPHKDMEIVSYMVDGELTHKDSMGNEKTLRRGDIQYMSAGTGVYHSEYNLSDNPLRLLQIWIMPDQKNYTPNYGDYKFDFDLRKGNWLHMVSSFDDKSAPVNIHQNANIYALSLEANETQTFDVQKARCAYLVQVEGNSVINDISVEERDSLEIVEETINIKATTKSHFLLIEMRKALLD